MKRLLQTAILLLGLAITEIVAQDDRQDATGDIPLETDGPADETMEDAMDMDMNMTEAPSLEGDDMMDMGNASFPTVSPTIPTMPPSSQDGCYDNLDAIYFLISDDDKLFQQKRYVICPGTVMDVGFLVPGTGIDKGQAPIIPRSNTEIICGEDGKVENNCILRGGDFAVIGVPVFFRQDLSVNNVLIKGFTFEGQVQYAAFLAVPGEIAFENCIFRVSWKCGRPCFVVMCFASRRIRTDKHTISLPFVEYIKPTNQLLGSSQFWHLCHKLR